MFVARFVYGVHVVFTTPWLVRWSMPARDGVVLLRDPPDATRTLLKGVLAVAGDHVRWNESRVQLNDESLPHRPHPDADRLFADVPDESIGRMIALG